MEKLAAIDVGSNAIRLAIGGLDEHGDISIIKKVREPVRLGLDVFGPEKNISEKTFEKALAAFVKFKGHLKGADVKYVKAVATSALREAANRDAFVAKVKAASGIHIDVIDGIEEGRLIFSAVAHRVNLNDKVALLIDIGGGSVELTVSDHGRAVATQTFKLGTVRLLQVIQQRGLEEKNLRPLIEELIQPAKDFLTKQMAKLHFDIAIGTGGNFETLGKLRVALLHKNSIFSMTAKEIGDLVAHLETMTIKERIQYLRLRPDRADVLIPAAHVTRTVMDIAQTEVLAIPYVGLRDGILTDLGQKVAF